MRIEVDPVWPWSELRQFLVEAPDPVVPLLVWGTGLLALALPLILLRPMTPRQQRQLLIGCGLWLVVQLVWVTRAGSPSSGVGVWEQIRFASLTLLVTLPLALLGWTIRTYFLAPGVTRNRLKAIIALRLGAVVCAIVAVTRPYLGFPDVTRSSAILVFLIDGSESMTIQDEVGGVARWDRLQRALSECQPLFAQLRSEQGIDVEFHRFGRDVSRWQPDNPGKPQGQRTDVGGALYWLYRNRDPRPLKGLFVLSDGRNNLVQKIDGEQRMGLKEARLRWRKLCKVNTVLLGSPNTPNGQRDVSVTRVTPTSSWIQIKSDLTVVARIDAPGFEGRKVKVRVFLDNDEQNNVKVESLQRVGDQQVYVKSGDQTVLLKDGRNNEVRVQLRTPAEAKEYKLTVKVGDPNADQHQALPGELNAANNEASTFITVNKGGISVLLVDRQRAGEPQLLYDVLKSDQRLSPRVVWLGSQARPLEEKEKNLFLFDKERYDVIILGDVLARDVQAVNPDGLNEIARLVQQGAGLVMLGGYSTFGNGDWQNTPLKDLLPVDLNTRGEEETKPIRMVPTVDPGLRLYGYVLGMGAGREETERAWEKLPQLDGMMKIHHRDGPGIHVLAKSNKGDDMLVAQTYGKGRVLGFAGDTTHRWTGTPEGRALHSRFWRQMTVWLARQEEASGTVWVKPDVRDVPVGTELGFNVGVHGKGGIDLPNGKYEVDVVLPSGKLKRVSTANSSGEDRGGFRPEEPGEYVIKVKGSAHDPEGNEVTGTAEAHFLAREEEVEMAEWSADKAFMDKLAKEGNGRAATAAELPDLLRDLLNPVAMDHGKPKQTRWPDWQSTRKSGFLPLFVLLFLGLLTGEWFLRRRWGMA